MNFDGTVAPLLYVSANQINVIAPNDLMGKATTRVVVAYHDQRSTALSVPVQDTAPGIYTVTGGNRQGAITQTPPNRGSPVTVNSVANPVEKGGTTIFYLTGAGLWNQDVRAGQVVFAPVGALEVKPRAPVAVKIAGIESTVYWTGAAPGTAGVVQVNAIVPDAVGAGEQPIEVTVGSSSNAPQRVTLHVR